MSVCQRHTLIYSLLSTVGAKGQLKKGVSSPGRKHPEIVDYSIDRSK
ncbi:hypothetical protein KSC_087370 [Ktedonobacter sp. SOSP1-52]|nr:hypothetical protein KSC_087370 [Ktedonobacter sp. SOSP1-52]